MSLGYRVKMLEDLPIIVVKLSLPPRLDTEHMFAEIARDILPLLGDGTRRFYRINDLSVFDNVPIAQFVIRGLDKETRGWAGTNTDPRLISIMVGKGDNVRLVIDSLKTERYGYWNVPAFDTLDDALEQIKRWEAGIDTREPERLLPVPAEADHHTLI